MPASRKAATTLAGRYASSRRRAAAVSPPLPSAWVVATLSRCQPPLAEAPLPGAAAGGARSGAPASESESESLLTSAASSRRGVG